MNNGKQLVKIKNIDKPGLVNRPHKVFKSFYTVIPYLWRGISFKIIFLARMFRHIYLVIRKI